MSVPIRPRARCLKLTLAVPALLAAWMPTSELLASEYPLRSTDSSSATCSDLQSIYRAAPPEPDAETARRSSGDPAVSDQSAEGTADGADGRIPEPAAPREAEVLEDEDIERYVPRRATRRPRPGTLEHPFLHASFMVTQAGGLPGVGTRVDLLSRSWAGTYISLGYEWERCDGTDDLEDICADRASALISEAGLLLTEGAVTFSFDANLTLPDLKNGPKTKVGLGGGVSIRYLATKHVSLELAFRMLRYRVDTGEVESYGGPSGNDPITRYESAHRFEPVGRVVIRF